jgi:hypothetical protein
MAAIQAVYAVAAAIRTSTSQASSLTKDGVPPLSLLADTTMGSLILVA